MINYSLQYEKLLQIVNHKLIEAKLQLEERQRERFENERELILKKEKEDSALLTFTLIKKEYDELLNMKVFDAVEEYKKAQGEYPGTWAGV